MTQRSGLRRLGEAFVHTWEKLQVELHGRYSVQHLHAMWSYSQQTSLAKACLVLLVTPLPCLAVISLTEAVTLQPPSAGARSNWLFWIRASFNTFVMAFGIFHEYCYSIPAIPSRPAEHAIMAAVVTACTTASAFAASLLVGFPVPFHYATTTPAFGTALVIAMAVAWGTVLRRDAAARSQLFNIQSVMNVLMVLILVYPTYSYVFISLDPVPQTLFTALLPFIKLVAKNLISPFCKFVEDSKPEVTVFNIEVFHALFVAISMQNATSVRTTVLLVAIDFAHMCVSLRDVSVLSDKINALRAKLYDGKTQQAADRDDRSTPLELAFYLIKHDKELHARPDIRFEVHDAAKFASAKRGNRAVAVSPGTESGVVPSAARLPARDVVMVGDVQSTARVSFVLERLPDGDVSKYEQKRLLSALTPNERVLYVSSMLKLMHMVEFILLIEFVEVIIPTVFSIYTYVVYNLPNCVYYAHLNRLTPEALLRNVGNVMVYAGLELGSFLVLQLLLQRKLQMSPIRQLAFVVETRWHTVQLKLIAWMLFMVQFSLEHFGADFTFNFAWLKK